MDSTASCRVCFANNVEMYKLTNTPLQEIYERLANVKLTSFLKRGEPACVLCFLCYAQLRRCFSFQQAAARAEDLLAQLYLERVAVTREVLSMIEHPPVHNYVTTPVENVSMNNTDAGVESCAEERSVKKEAEIERDADSQGDDVNEETEDAQVKLKRECESEQAESPESSECDFDEDVPLQLLRTPAKRRRVEEREVTNIKFNGSMPKIDAREVILTYEQQREAMSARAASLNYLNSPHRCTLCYRGYINMAAYTNHMEKHAEAICKRIGGRRTEVQKGGEVLKDNVIYINDDSEESCCSSPDPSEPDVDANSAISERVEERRTEVQKGGEVLKDNVIYINEDLEDFCCSSLDPSEPDVDANTAKSEHVGGRKTKVQKGGEDLKDNVVNINEDSEETCCSSPDPSEPDVDANSATSEREVQKEGEDLKDNVININVVLEETCRSCPDPSEPDVDANSAISERVAEVQKGGEVPKDNVVGKNEALEETSCFNPDPSETDADANYVLDLLKNSIDGRAILNRGQSNGGLLDNTLRCRLSRLIATQELTDNPTGVVPGHKLMKYAKDIAKIFPKESPSIYYIPYMSATPQQIKKNASGKLYDGVVNKRKDLRRRGVISGSSRCAKSSEAGSVTHVEETQLTLLSKSEGDESEVKEKLQWLRKSVGPWHLVESNWSDTTKARLATLQSEPATVEEYFNLYPALKKPEGFRLVRTENENNENENNLFLQKTHKRITK